MTQEHTKYEQEVIYSTTYDTENSQQTRLWDLLRLAPIMGSQILLFHDIIMTSS